MSQTDEPLELGSPPNVALRDDWIMSLLPGRAHRLLAFGLVAITSFLFCRSAFYTIFTAFRTYDDEGSMLLVLAGLAKGKILYDQLSTMYGPRRILSESRDHQVVAPQGKS